jgi:hypothetical protein
MSEIINGSSCYWFNHGEIFIISDAPGAEEAMKKNPELPAKPLKELEAML